MTRRVRRNHSPAFKAKVALAAIKGEKTYLAFYNGRRPHQGLGRQTPDQAYFNALQPIPAAA